MVSGRLPGTNRGWIYNHGIFHSQSSISKQKETVVALASIDIEQYVKLASNVKFLLKQDFYLSYDAETDVVYVNFHNPAKQADDSELTDNDIIVRYNEQQEVINLTILHASQQQ